MSILLPNQRRFLPFNRNGIVAESALSTDCMSERPYRVLALPKAQSRRGGTQLNTAQNTVGAANAGPPRGVGDGIKSLRSAWRTLPFKTVSFTCSNQLQSTLTVAAYSVVDKACTVSWQRLFALLCHITFARTFAFTRMREHLIGVAIAAIGTIKLTNFILYVHTQLNDLQGLSVLSSSTQGACENI